MPQSLVKVSVHIVFGTKQRKNLIPQNRLEGLWSYMGGIARNQKISLVIAGGMRDHVHMLVEVPATRNCLTSFEHSRPILRAGCGKRIGILSGRVVMALVA